MHLLRIQGSAINANIIQGTGKVLLFAQSKAEDTPAGWAEDHGMEWDLSLSYKLYDNLTYDLMAAFLTAGNFWKYGDPTVDLNNTWSIYQKLKLEF